MPNPDDKLPLLELTDKEKSALPLGYNQIYVKAISPKQAEIAVTVYSRKYRKADLLALASEKPISKIMPWKEDSNDD
jgi:hypothetical protein